MNSRPYIWIGLTVGSTIGAYIPSLWGADVFSIWSIILSAVGGILGVWAGYKLGENLG